MDDGDRIRLAREASAVEQAMATLAGDDPGSVPAQFVESAAETVLTELLTRYEYLRDWVDQAVRLTEAQAAVQLAEETEGISSAVRRALIGVVAQERWNMEQARYPSADDPAAVLSAYASVAAIVGRLNQTSP